MGAIQPSFPQISPNRIVMMMMMIAILTLVIDGK